MATMKCAPWKKSYYKPKQYMKKQRHHFVNKGLSSQSYGFSTRHVWMWKLDHKELLLLNCGVEKTLENPMDSMVIKPVNPKGNQPWTFIGRTDDEAEAPVLWPPDAKNWFIGKIEGRRRRGQQRIRWLDGITGSMDMSLSELREIVKDRETWHAIVHGVLKSWTWLNNWTTTTVRC